MDIFARTQSPGDYSIIGEVKNREEKKFSKDEVLEFENKFVEVKKAEKIERVVGFIFPAAGLQKKRTNIAKQRELLAVKMKGGWKPGILSRPLFDENNGRLTVPKTKNKV